MNYDDTANYLLERISATGHPIPKVAVVLGSGLGKLGEMIENPLIIPYCEIPHFKVSTAIGHKGNIIVGTLSGKEIMVMQGRFHYYEGYSMDEITYPVRVFARMGIQCFLVSNAAGAVNPDYNVGDLMLISDHINFMPNPLVGPNREEFGPRFPDMTEVYSPRMRKIAHEEAHNLGIYLREGVYVAGMSTIPEVIVARHCGMEIFGISVITNQSSDLGNGIVNNGDDVVQMADKAADKMNKLFSRIINRI